MAYLIDIYLNCPVICSIYYDVFVFCAVVLYVFVIAICAMWDSKVFYSNDLCTLIGIVLCLSLYRYSYRDGMTCLFSCFADVVAEGFMYSGCLRVCLCVPNVVVNTVS